MTQHDHEIITALYPQIKRFVRSKVPEPDCYDLANEAIKLFVATDRRSVANPRGYVFGIARNLVLKFYARHRPSQPFDSTRMSVADFGSSVTTRLDRRNRVLAALRTLPLDLQIAVELRFAEELTLQETADTLEVSLATIKRYLDDAKARLATALGSANAEIDDTEAAQLVEVYKNA